MKKYSRVLTLLLAVIMILSCAACGGKDEEGLIYKEVDTGYIVTGYSGDVTDLVIPDTYNGKPVIEIKDFFVDTPDDIRTVSIGKNIETIGIWAFYNCSGLTSFSVDEQNENFTSVDGVIFNKNKDTLCFYPYAHNVEEKYLSDKKLGAEYEGVDYRIPEGTKTVGANAFFHNMFLKSVVFPDSVTVIEKNAFLGCEKLASVRMSANLRVLSSHALFKCTTLKEITLPATLEEVGDYAMFNCDEMENVYMQIESEEALKSAGSGWLPKPGNKKVPIEWNSKHGL